VLEVDNEVTRSAKYAKVQIDVEEENGEEKHSNRWRKQQGH
jgi:hypothetical protein